MIRVCLSALLSHWRRNPLQLFAFLAGLALATALWSGVQAINAEARASYAAAAETLGEGQFDQLVPRAGTGIPVETYVALRTAGWLVSPVLDGRLNGVRIVGIDPVTSPTSMGAFANGPESDDLLFDASDILFGSEAVARTLGDLATVRTNATIAPGLAVGDIGFVQRLLGRQDLSRLLIQPHQPMRQPDLADIAPDLRLQPSQQTTDIAGLTDSFHLNLTAFGLLSFAVGLFIVHSTIGLAFEQRRGMIRTLRSLGVPLRTLVILITVEMLGLALAGAAAGIVLGYLIAALLLPDVAATLRGLYGASISGTLALRAEWWLSGLALAMTGTAFALMGRLWQIARMPVLASVRPRAWAMATAARFRIQSMTSAGLLALSGLFALFGNGLAAGFVLLGCLLTGAALALPALASLALTVAQNRTARPVLTWFWADTRQQVPGLSLALMALLLAVSANIGVSTMVSSFRLTFVAFLDQRLAPELFVQADTQEDGQRLQAWLQREKIETLPILSTATIVASQPVRLYGVRVGPTYRDNWLFLQSASDAWDQVANGRGVVVNEQLARRSDLWVGAILQITPDLTLPVAAVVGDYGNPSGQVFMGEGLFEQLYPDVFALQFGLRTNTPAALRTELVSEVGLENSAITNQAAVKSLSMGIFDRTFAVTGALNVLTLGVAGFAILMSLLTLADLRLPQLAPVWALGLTRSSLGRMELVRAVVLAALVFVCALPIGLALAWVLLAIINVEAFGWQLPMFLFPAEYARLGAYAMVAALVAAAWPAWRLMRTPPSALLKVFANER